MNKHSGSCLCAGVRFEVDGNFERFYLCHCGHCRKDTGSAHAANLFTTTAALKWLSGQEKVAQFTLPGTRHSRSFCSVCGSALPSLQMNGALLLVPAGSLGQGAGGHFVGSGISSMSRYAYSRSQQVLIKGPQNGETGQWLRRSS